MNDYPWSLARWLPCDRCGLIPALPHHYPAPCRCTRGALVELGMHLARLAERRIDAEQRASEAGAMDVAA